MKKIIIALVVCMFIFSSLTIVVDDNQTDEYTLKVRKFIEIRNIIPIYTEHGLEKIPPNKGGGGKNKPPTVTITNPQNGMTVSGIVTITVSVYDKEDTPAPTPIIIIDGIQVAQAFSYEWNTDPISVGSHSITAIATDSGGKTGSDSITVYKGEGGPGAVDKYALVIGISDYDGGTVNDLQYCDDDARDWMDFLEEEGYSVTILTDSQATASAINSAVDALLAIEDGNDYVVFTYSGHGIKYNVYGSSIVSSDLYYMTHGWLEAKFASADSPHIYFAFDACVIGDFKGLISTNRVGAFASNRRYSYDGDTSMQNGVFTYFQMIGWSSFDNFEGDGTFAVQQMKNWASSVHVRVDPFVQDRYTGDMIP